MTTSSIPRRPDYRHVAEGVGCGTAAGHLPIARGVADSEYPAAANLLNGARAFAKHFDV